MNFYESGPNVIGCISIRRIGVDRCSLRAWFLIEAGQSYCIVARHREMYASRGPHFVQLLPLSAAREVPRLGSSDYRAGDGRVSGNPEGKPIGWCEGLSPCTWLSSSLGIC